MTLTEARPVDTDESASVEHGKPRAYNQIVSGFASGDHKAIGRLFVLTAFAYIAIGSVVGALVQIERSSKGIKIFGNQFPQYFGAVYGDMILVGLVPLLIGLAVAIVPLQIGATRIAFPRLTAFAYWAYLGGALCQSAAHLLGGPDGAGYILPQPLRSNPQGASTEMRLWLCGLGLVSIAVMIATISVVVTIFTQRRPGMSMWNIPLFSGGFLGASAVILIAGAAHLGGAALFLTDQLTGGVFFRENTFGTRLVWQHLLWIPGRPELLVISVPAFGALADICSTSMKRPLFQHRVAALLLTTSAALTALAWSTNLAAQDSIFVGTPTFAAAAWVAPLGLVLLLCLATLAPSKGRKPKLSIALLALPVVGLIVAGGVANVLISLATEVHVGSSWSAAHVFLVMIAVPVVMAIASAHYWSSKIVGRQLPGILSAFALLCVTGGIVVVAGAQYILGYSGGSWLSADVSTKFVGSATVPSDSTFTSLSLVTAVGFILLALGAIVIFAELVLAAFGMAKKTGNNPVGGVTLEWATTSPPPAYNFDSIPPVFGPAPLLGAESDTATSVGASV